MLTDYDVERIADAVVRRMGIQPAKPAGPQSMAERLIELAKNPETRQLSIEMAKAHSRANRTRKGASHA